MSLHLLALSEHPKDGYSEILYFSICFVFPLPKLVLLLVESIFAVSLTAVTNLFNSHMFWLFK